MPGTPLFTITFLLLFLLHLTTAEMGYGPGFDACGDSCQTELRLFCTELRDAQQQRECWCRDTQIYYEHVNACLESCADGWDGFKRQKGLLLRYRGVVCGARDAEFEEYYNERYGGEFDPDPIRNAPPPPVVVQEKTVEASRTRSSVTTRTRTRSLNSELPTSTSVESSRVSRTATVTPTPTQSSSEEGNDDSDDNGGAALPTGAIAGIAAGSSSVVIALVLAAVIIYHRKKRESEKSPVGTPPVNWPPNLERRVSIYYSPDDVGRTPTTPRAQTGNWQLPHPGQRVPSVATTILEDSASDYDGSSSSGSRSTWTVIEGVQDQFYDVDLGVAR